MSHDGISFEFSPRPPDPPLDKGEAVKKFYEIYLARREEQMDWRVRALIEQAYEEGFMAGKASRR